MVDTGSVSFDGDATESLAVSFCLLLEAAAVLESVGFAVDVVLELAASEERVRSNRPKSMEAVGRSVPPMAVAVVTAVEMVALPTCGKAPYQGRGLLGWWAVNVSEE